MEQYLPVINTLLGLGAVVLMAFVALVLVAILFTSAKLQHPLVKFVGRQAFVITFIIALGGMMMSLFYSNIIGFYPCSLCWIQRIFMYPQVFMLGLALWKKDTSIVDYSIFLSVIGAIVALYHKYVEIAGDSAFCSDGASCAKVYVNEFGFVTIPVMALTAFVAMIVVMSVRRFSK